jgi:xylan 1,4-beta-xylosidase
MFEGQTISGLRLPVNVYCTNSITPTTKIYFSMLKIYCVLEGKVILLDSFSNYLLREGDIHIVNPSYPYRLFDKEKDNSSTLLVVEIDLEYYKRFFVEINDNLYLTCRVSESDYLFLKHLSHVRFLLAKLYYLSIAEHCSEVDLDVTTKELLTFFLKHFHHYTYKKQEDGRCMIVLDTEARHEYDTDMIYRIIDYIYDHCTERIKLQDIASREYLSISHLSRYISQKSGLSFTEHLSMARCEHAEELLVTTSKGVDDIAEESGFANRQHLLKEFRRWFNSTPSEYRRNYLVTPVTKEKNNPLDMKKALKQLKKYMRFSGEHEWHNSREK